MTEHEVRAIRRGPLSNQLAGLGLIRVLAEQADPRLRCWFAGSSLLVDTAVDDLATWLVDSYVPMPVLDPWNDGSGYGPKDKAPKAALDRLLSIDSDRLDPLRRAHEAIAPLAANWREHKGRKEDFVAAIRSRCPDEMLPWIDAAVVALDRDRVAYPPLLGSGGNDGRLEFSTNFHQRLLDVLPTDSRLRAASLACARDWLNQTSLHPAARAAVGQFDPGSAGTPNSSPFGAAESLVNPWLYVLMIEGVPLFASAPARRLNPQTAATTSTRAAMTFMTEGSEAGSSSGSAVEESRGEVWVPRWDRPLSYASVQQIFTEGRAVWQGRTVTRSSHMYLAAASQGVSPGVSAFERYTIVKRNGLAFSAVRADEVRTRSDDAMLVVGDVEGWPDAVRRKSLPGGIEHLLRMFDAARVDVARKPSGPGQIHAIRDMLAAVTSLEVAVGRSTRMRDDTRPRTPASARNLLDLFATPAWSATVAAPEFTIALGLASVVSQPLSALPRGRTLRDLVLPINPPVRTGESPGWRAVAVVPGFGVAPVADILAEATRWLITTARYEIAPGRANAIPITGVAAPRRGIAVPWEHLHRWVRGGLDERKLSSWLHALIALDWRRDLNFTPPQPAPTTIDPALAVIGQFRSGVPSERDDTGTRYALTSEWIARLLAGRVHQVHKAARARLRQVGINTVTAGSADTDRVHGRRIAAALLPASDTRTPLRRVSRRLVDQGAAKIHRETTEEFE